MFRGHRIAVVVPAFNEVVKIARTVRSVPGFVDHVLVIDDASADGTGKRARRSQRRGLEVIRHPENRGVGAAIATGYARALEPGRRRHRGDGRRLADGSRRPDGAAGGGGRGRGRLRQGQPLPLAGRLAGDAAVAAVRQPGAVVPHPAGLGLPRACSTRSAGTPPPTGGRWPPSSRGPVFPRYGYPNDLLVRLGRDDAAGVRRAGAAGVRPATGARGSASARWSCRSRGCCRGPSPSGCCGRCCARGRLAAALYPAACEPVDRPSDRLFVTTSYPRFEGDPAGCFVAGARARLHAAPAARRGCWRPASRPGPTCVMSGPGLTVERIGLRRARGRAAVLRRGRARTAGGRRRRRPSCRRCACGPGCWPPCAPARRPATIESHWLVPSALAVVCAGPAGRAPPGPRPLRRRGAAGAAAGRRRPRARACWRRRRSCSSARDLRARFAALVGPAPAAAGGGLSGRARRERAGRPRPGSPASCPRRSGGRCACGWACRARC